MNSLLDFLEIRLWKSTHGKHRECGPMIPPLKKVHYSIEKGRVPFKRTGVFQCKFLFYLK